jgi:hypothetical protein
MTTRVRIYFHSGFEPLPAKPGSPKQPYLGRSIIDADHEAKASTPAPKGTTVAVINTDDSVHIEIRPPQDPRPADSHSPILGTNAAVTIGPDWVISVMEYGHLEATDPIPFDLPEAAQ